MMCPFRNKGCTFSGSADEVMDHVDYMISVDDDEHKRARGGGSSPRCNKQPRIKFDQIHEDIHLTCECGMDVNLGQEPIVADVVFAWQNHSSMKRREDDSGGPRN